MPDEPIPSAQLPLYTTQQRNVHPSLEDPERAAINKALALLSDEARQSMPNIELVRDTGKHLPGYQQQIEGFTKPNDDNIYVPNNSRVYQRASKGDRDALVKLASDIMHERHHVEHGRGEGAAYDVQLSILKLLGASPATVAEVQKSRDFVTTQGGKP